MHARASMALCMFAETLEKSTPRRKRGVHSAKTRRAFPKKQVESNEAMLVRFMPGEHNSSRSTKLQKATIKGQDGQRVSKRMRDNRHLLERTTLTVARLKIASKLRKDAAKREQRARLQGVQRMVAALKLDLGDLVKAHSDHEARVFWHLQHNAGFQNMPGEMHFLLGILWSWFSQVMLRRIDDARLRLESITKRKAHSGLGSLADFGESPETARIILKRCIFERWELYVSAITGALERGKLREINRVYRNVAVPRTYCGLESQTLMVRRQTQISTMENLMVHRRSSMMLAAADGDGGDGAKPDSSGAASDAPAAAPSCAPSPPTTPRAQARGAGSGGRSSSAFSAMAAAVAKYREARRRTEPQRPRTAPEASAPGGPRAPRSPPRSAPPSPRRRAGRTRPASASTAAESAADAIERHGKFAAAIDIHRRLLAHREAKRHPTLAGVLPRRRPATARVASARRRRPPAVAGVTDDERRTYDRTRLLAKSAPASLAWS